MKILLTGSSGFIGKYLKAEFIKRGHGIIEYDLPERSILDEVELYLRFLECDLIFHNAAIANLNDSMAQMDKNFEVNIRGTYNVANLAREAKKPVIFVSTCCVYGNSLTEDIQTEWISIPMCNEPYACSKVAGEYIFRGMPDLKWIVLRSGTVYGPGMRQELFNYISLYNILNDIPIQIHGDGKQTRQYVYIDDLVKGFVLMTENFKENEIINLCGIEKISVLDSVKIAEMVVGKKAIIEYGPDRYGQTYHENISIKKAMGFNWFPEIPFNVGMKKTFEGDARLGAGFIKDIA